MIFSQFWPEHFKEQGNSFCPFHQDQNASLQISKDFAFCYAESLKLDAVDLYERGAKVSRSDALSLASLKEHGIEDHSISKAQDFALRFEHLPKDSALRGSQRLPC